MEEVIFYFRLFDRFVFVYFNGFGGYCIFVGENFIFYFVCLCFGKFCIGIYDDGRIINLSDENYYECSSFIDGFYIGYFYIKGNFLLIY